MLPQTSAEHYQEQQTLILGTLAATRRTWAGMTVDLDGSWPQVLNRLLLLVTAAQIAAAESGAAYVPAVLAELDLPDEPAATVAPRLLAGAAADGRPLDTFLFTALTATRGALGGGATIPQALARGGRWLDMAVATTVADTGRQATSVGIVARPSVAGWVRMVNTPSCSRCVLLAGRFYRWNRGFQRHPGCDCRHIPASESLADDLTVNPRKLIEAGQVTGLSRADTKAIVEDGADPAQVINARRGMRAADAYGHSVNATTEGTARGVARRVLEAQGGSYTRTPRLRPEAIYRLARDRDDAIRLLRRFGYVT